MEKNIYRSVQPPSALAPFVRRFMIADCDRVVDLQVPARPTGYVYLGWVLQGQATAVVNGAFEFDSNDSKTHISGQIRNAEILMNIRGRFQHVLAEFTALGAFQLLGVEGEDIFEKCVEVASLDQALASDLEDRIDRFSPRTPDAGMAMFIDLLGEAAKDPRSVPDYLLKSVEQIETAHGGVRVGDICAELGVSERQFSRSFSRVVGLSPKAFSKTLQVNRAIGLFFEEVQQGLAETAVQSGFADQQHFTKVFKEVVLDSPMAFFSSDEDMLFTFLARSSRPRSDAEN